MRYIRAGVAVVVGCCLLAGLFWLWLQAVDWTVFWLVALTYALLTSASLYFSRTSKPACAIGASGKGRCRELLDLMSDAVILTGPVRPYPILEANRMACERLGFAREELLRMNAGDLVDLDAAEKLYRRSKQEGADGRRYFELDCRTRSGGTIPVEANMGALRTPEGKIIVTTARDLSERKQMEERIRHMAYYDDMTGLPNRRLFRDRLTRAMEEARTKRSGVAVFYLDIDRFKLVNDSFGHDYGDMLLLQVAERYMRCITDADFLGRTEGDEFALFFYGVTDASDVLPLAKRIFDALKQPFAVGEYQIHITTSIGIALFSGKDREDADTVMKYADIALSRAKEKGKNNFQIYNADMNTISLTRLTVENELRRALLRGEFELYFQPQIEIGSGAIVGMEALIRWNHPEKGVVQPRDFISIAEESGLIVPIGEWVIQEACKQNKKWQDSGFPAVPVSVNLSIGQFMQHNLKGKISSILGMTGLEPRYLELEITESMTMDVEFATNLLLELKKLGVQISIDDFGTGYSSLYLLKKFPIDKLKIDRSFVRDIMVDPNDAAIVATIISMTHHLNLKVIAEGVETEEQLQFLHQNRCHQVQGYWFSPPVPARQMEEMIRRNGKAATGKPSTT